MRDLYAVMGNPIAHSKSPFIHTQFAVQTKQSLDYKAILVDKNAFPQAVSAFQAKSGRGLNITVPFKEEAWQLVDEKSVMAEKAGAVNTIIVKEDGALLGDNTDGVGIVRDIKLNHGVSLAGKRILILGAGGAVRGVLGPILNEEPDSITIANRTVSRAQALLEIFNVASNIQAKGFDEITGKFDVVINGTAASLSGEMPPIPSNCVVDSICYDMMYAKEDTVFMQWAKQHGASKTLDGLGMLVEQAAESFYLWRDVRPDTQSVIESVRKSFS